MRRSLPHDTPEHLRRVTVALGLGTNLGDRAAHLREAMRRLRAVLTDVRRSPVYDTAPFGVLDQPRFLNMVVVGNTTRSLDVLLATTQRIERAMGRQRRERNGPREIDLDLLLYGDAIIRTPTLTVPHPALHERATVLVPLTDIAPTMAHPVLGVTIATLRERVDATTCVPWPMSWNHQLVR